MTRAIIPLDRRPRLGMNIQQWLGDSRGWWEGRTLVVETTNFNDKRRFQGSTKDVRLVERFTRVDPDTISYRLTVTDSKSYSQPWTLENTLWKSDEPMFESGCHEGNYGLASILAGGRADREALMSDPSAFTYGARPLVPCISRRLASHRRAAGRH